MTLPPPDEYDVGSRVEAAEAGVHQEAAEAAEGRVPDEHVTATDVAAEPVSERPAGRAPMPHHHHPLDPNIGVVRGRLGRGAVIAAVLSGAVTVVAVVLFALAVGGS